MDAVIKIAADMPAREHADNRQVFCCFLMRKAAGTVNKYATRVNHGKAESATQEQSIRDLARQGSISRCGSRRSAAAAKK